ncbi:hypothetical protein PENSPDRAFT_730263 [Peniophora sp. CONT]|nr:hypothetical protein PENSPDRAFT_730263 [Peniophora sp. CONT]
MASPLDMMPGTTWFSSSPPHTETAERRSSQPQVPVAALPSFVLESTANSFPATLDLLDYHPAYSSAFQAPQSVHWADYYYSHAHPRDINPPPPLANPSPSSLAYPTPSSTSTMAIIPLNRPVPTPPVFPAPPPIEDAHTGLEDAQTPSSTSSGGRTREKRHACWMCHKAFDRPSTLRKHLLVHTGEKAFACDKCGRRFGVLSNLNRHLRKCSPETTKAAEANTPEDATPAPESSSPGSTASPAASADSPATVALETVPTRGRASATIDAAGSGGASTSRKRRARRAPSPERWVPESLRTFNLTTVDMGCSVPLPPVLPSQGHAGMIEERDSYEEIPSDKPYHPEGWRGRLPGPGLRDIITSGVSSMGRLVFF